MKTLSNYIFEKLVINKNFKNITYKAVKPSEYGVCLYIVFPLKSTNTESVVFRITNYKYDEETDVVTVGQFTEIYKQNDGFYILSGNTYFFIFLFNDDAKDFLNNILNDPEQKIHISDFLNDIPQNVKSKGLQCIHDEGGFYTDRDINDMLKEIE